MSDRVTSANGSKTQVAGWTTYTFLLWTIKAAMCAFYLRLTVRFHHGRQRIVRDADTKLQDGLGFQRRVYIGFAVIGITWVAVLLSILLGCQPLHKNWQIYPDPGSTSPFS
jgi:hypothetical protein